MNQLLQQYISQKLGIFPLSTLPCQETPPSPCPGDGWGCVLGMESVPQARCAMCPHRWETSPALCCLSAWMEPLPVGLNLGIFHVFSSSRSCGAEFRVEDLGWEVGDTICGGTDGTNPAPSCCREEERPFQECLNTTPAGFLGSRTASRGSSVVSATKPWGVGVFWRMKCG